MSRHEGVSCDSCLTGNFMGRRYKCLICYDYDLCANCYERGVTTTRHMSSHPMQCILTRVDLDLFYGGEMSSHSSSNPENTMSYTCPFCSKLGFTEITLVDHVSSQHSDCSQEVVCPICAALQGGDPNLVTDDFAAHLTVEHRTGPRDLISFLDSPSGGNYWGSSTPLSRAAGVRRVPHASRGVTGSTRARRTANVHNPNPHSSVLSSMSPRENTVDPIAELLSQLSGVRRATSSSSSTSSSQLQQLHMQLQLERQQAQHLSNQQRAPAPPRARSGALVFGRSPNATPPTGPRMPGPNPTVSVQNHPLHHHQQHHHHHHQSTLDSDTLHGIAQGMGEGLRAEPPVGGEQFLLRQSSSDEDEPGKVEQNKLKSQFVVDLVLSSLVDNVSLSSSPVEGQSQASEDKPPSTTTVSTSML